MCTKRSPAQRGVSMVELIMFIVVVSIALTGVIGAMSYVTKHSPDAGMRKQAMLIAEALLEEVEQGRFTYCKPDDANLETATSAATCADTVGEVFGPPSGYTRPYPNVNDYVSANAASNSFTSGDATGIITDIAGNRYFSGNTVSDSDGAKYFGSTYTARVTINSETKLGPSTAYVPATAVPTNADTNALHIRITVSYGSGDTLILDGYRTRFAPNTL